MATKHADATFLWLYRNRKKLTCPSCDEKGAIAYGYYVIQGRVAEFKCRNCGVLHINETLALCNGFVKGGKDTSHVEYEAVKDGETLMIFAKPDCGYMSTEFIVAEAWELDTINPLVKVFHPIGVNGLREIVQLVLEHKEQS